MGVQQSEETSARLLVLFLYAIWKPTAFAIMGVVLRRADPTEQYRPRHLHLLVGHWTRNKTKPAKINTKKRPQAWVSVRTTATRHLSN